MTFHFDTKEPIFQARDRFEIYFFKLGYLVHSFEFSLQRIRRYLYGIRRVIRNNSPSYFYFFYILYHYCLEDLGMDREPDPKQQRHNMAVVFGGFAGYCWFLVHANIGYKPSSQK